MKKIVLCTLMCMAVWQMNAQEIHFIPKVGLNLANITGEWGDNVRPGVNIGVSAEVLLTPSFAIEPGIFYSSQGTKWKMYASTEEGSSPTKAKSVLKNDYLNIPIYAKYYWGESGFYVFGGPQFGFNVLSKSKIKLDDWSDKGDTKDAVNTFDFSVGLGLGYQFDCGFLISANYNLGLTEALKIGDGRNSVFQANVGWRF